MTNEERNMIILQINTVTGWTMDLLNSLPDEELLKIHEERVAKKGRRLE